jgi:hypothetical protein
VAATAGLLGAALTVPPARRFLGLAAPGPLGWLLVVAATAVTARLTSPTAADGTRAASDQSDDGVRDRGWDAGRRPTSGRNRRISMAPSMKRSLRMTGSKPARPADPVFES